MHCRAQHRVLRRATHQLSIGTRRARCQRHAYSVRARAGGRGSLTLLQWLRQARTHCGACAVARARPGSRTDAVHALFAPPERCLEAQAATAHVIQKRCGAGCPTATPIAPAGWASPFRPASEASARDMLRFNERHCSINLERRGVDERFQQAAAVGRRCSMRGCAVVARLGRAPPGHARRFPHRPVRDQFRRRRLQRRRCLRGRSDQGRQHARAAASDDGARRE